jgi:hypothetical protein
MYAIYTVPTTIFIPHILYWVDCDSLHKKVGSVLSEYTFKGLSLEKWNSPILLSMLTDDELIELHALMYSEIIDLVEGRVDQSLMFEAKMIIQHIKDNA